MLLFFIGVLFSVVGFYMVYDAHYYRKYARHYIGEVVRHEKKISSSTTFGQTRYDYYPVIKYWADNKEYQFTSDIGSSTHIDEVGSSVDVLVLGDQHSTARLRLKSRLFLAYALSVVGTIVLFISFSNNLLFVPLGPIIIVLSVLIVHKIVLSTRQKGLHIEDPRFIKDPAICPEDDKVNETLPLDASPTKHIGTTRKLVSGLFFILSLLLFVYALNNAYEIKNFDGNSIKIEGEIVEDRTHREGGLTIHTAIVAYQIRGEEPKRYDAFSTANPEFKVGDNVELAYDPAHTADIHIYSQEFMYAFVVAMLVVSLGLLLIAVGLFFIRL